MNSEISTCKVCIHESVCQDRIQMRGIFEDKLYPKGYLMAGHTKEDEKYARARDEHREQIWHILSRHCRDYKSK